MTKVIFKFPQSVSNQEREATYQALHKIYNVKNGYLLYFHIIEDSGRVYEQHKFITTYDYEKNKMVYLDYEDAN